MNNSVFEKHAISRIICRVVKEKTCKTIEAAINSLKVELSNESAVIDFDISVGQIRLNEWLPDIPGGTAISALKMYDKSQKMINGCKNFFCSIFNPSFKSNQGGIIQELTERIRNSLGLDTEIVVTEFNKSTNNQIGCTIMAGKVQINSKNSFIINKRAITEKIESAIKEKTGFDIKVHSIYINSLNLDVSCGNIVINVDAGVDIENPGIIGKLSIMNGVFQKFLVGKIIEFIRNSLNAEIKLNINNVSLTSVNNDIAISLNGNAEISDYALSSIFDKVYR